MTLDMASGNVGIGTTSPGAKLEVAGGETKLEQQAWQSVSFQNSWVNYGEAGYNVAGYFKDSMGVVHLRGLIKSGTIARAAFTLPVGYRPPGKELIGTISNNGAGRVDVEVDGKVVPRTPSHNAWVSLDGLSFRAAQ